MGYVKRGEHRGVPIFVDTDQSLGYETNSSLRKVWNIFFIPILNTLPIDFQKFVKRSHRSAEAVIEHATTHRALEHLYASGKLHTPRHFFERAAHNLWFNLSNAKAVRNRLRLVQKELEAIIRQCGQDRQVIYLMSIAAGSARAILQALQSFTDKPLQFFTTFLDRDAHALDYSRELRRQLLPENDRYHFSWVRDTAGNFNRYTQGRPLDIVEMVGLLDYFDDEKVKQILSLIYEGLSEGGVLITANICDNRERRFITRVVGWPMVYRRAEDLIDLAISAGFDRPHIRIVYEPLRIHAIMVAGKA